MDREPGRVRVVRRAVELRLMVCLALPRAVEVVSLYRCIVEGTEDPVGLEAGVDLAWVGGQERAQRVGAPDLSAIGVELGAELGQIRGEVCPCLLAGSRCRLPSLPGHSQSMSMPSNTPAGAGPALRLTTDRRQVPLDEQVDATPHRGAPIGRQRRWRISTRSSRPTRRLS